MNAFNSSSLFASLLVATTMYAGPIPFSVYDRNGDGVIVEKEFYETQAKNMEKKAEEGRAMRNAANAPVFSDVDNDNDGKITEYELLKFQQKRMSENRNNRQQGKGNKGW